MDTGQKLLRDALESEATGTTVTSKYRGLKVVFKQSAMGMMVEAVVADKYCTCWTYFPTSITPVEHINTFIKHLKKAIDDSWLKELRDMGQI